MKGLQKTPLFEIHKELGARMVPFAGYNMPVQYTSIADEHRAVRNTGGLFDISHMGQINIAGQDSEVELERLLTCKVGSLRPGHVRYGLLCNDSGGVIDDITIYRIDTDRFLLCVNAVNIKKDREWIESHVRGSVDIKDLSKETALLALQGPISERILETLGPDSISKLRRFQFLESLICNKRVLVSRTGYTGSSGFELYTRCEDVGVLWNTLLSQGSEYGLLPAGLGARDTLRIEAALPLYGHELTETTSPLEAQLDRFVKLDEGGFIGAEAIKVRLTRGHSQILVGFEMIGRGIARDGYEIEGEGGILGHVTSGAPSPYLKKAIGLGYIPPSMASMGSEINIRIRDRLVPARIVRTPFFKNP